MSTTGLRTDGVPPELTSLGPCRLLRRLGEGGMGTVYLAEMREPRPWAATGDRVAVKVLQRLHSPPQARARFEREARLGLAVTHPSVVRTFVADVAEVMGQEQPYLVLEYLEGRTLRDVMDELRPVPEALLRPIAAQVARALAAVHDLGIVHRDLKPTNVMISPTWQVKLLDLGTARLLEPTAALTAEGAFVGTLRYAAPEQVRGDDLGPAADLHALGVMLHEAATGTHPFESEDLRVLIRRLLDETPLPLTRLAPDVSPLLERLVAQLTAKSPAERPVSAREVAGILDDGESSPWWRDAQRPTDNAAQGVRGRIRVPRATALVGREAEAAVLEAELESVRRGGGRVVLIEGEAGIGKTRLLDAWLEAVGREGHDVTVLHGSAAPGDAAGEGGPIAAALRDHLGTRLPDIVASRLAANPMLVEAILRLTGHSSSRSSRSDEPEELLGSALAELARALAARAPLVWLVEDLHFARAEQRRLFAALARAAADMRLLLVGTTRPGSESDLGDLAKRPHVRRLRLARLSPAEVLRLLGAYLGSDSLADRIGGQVARKTDGNPYFVLEVLNDLRDRGLLARRDDGSFRATGEISHVEVPSAVRELIVQRLDDLADSDRALLDAASVQGFRFDGDLVARVLELRRLDVLQALARLERRRGLVRADGALFRFDHHQMQEVIAAELPPALASEYHERLADAFASREELAGKPPSEVSGPAAAFLVQHQLMGSAPARAKPLLDAAFDHLLQLHDAETCRDLARLAIERMGGDAVVRAQARLREDTALQRVGSADERRAVLEDALDAAQRSGRADLRARSLTALGQLELLTARPGAAEPLLREAEEVAKTCGEIDARGDAMRWLCASFGLRGRYDEAEATARRTLEWARGLGLRGHEGHAHADLAAVEEQVGCPEAANAAWRAALALGEELGDAMLQLRCLPRLSVNERKAGRMDVALELGRRCLELGRQVGSKSHEAAGWGMLAHVALARDQLAESIGPAERAHELFAEAGNTTSIAMAREVLCRIALGEGRLDDAKRFAQSALGALAGRDMPQAHVPCGLALAEAHLLEGHAAEAVTCCERALVLARASGDASLTRGACRSLGRALAVLGRREEALTLLDEGMGGAPDPGEARSHALERAHVALLGACDAESLDEHASDPLATRARTLLLLARAGSKRDCAARARRHLETLFERVSDGAKATFWTTHWAARMLREVEEGGAA